LQKLVSQTTTDLSSAVQKLQIKVAELERNQKQSK
jgi:outer membrane murein-binding lipoprotein Lpp